MVKHIKKSYKKDGKLTKDEKSIAYATAWKNYNKKSMKEDIKTELLTKANERHKKAKSFKQFNKDAGRKPLRKGEVRKYDPKTKTYKSNMPEELSQMSEESCGKGEYYCHDMKKCKPIPKGMKVGKDGMLVPIKEGNLHKWFSGSKSKDGKGGWVNVVTGGTCASDEPGEGTPKCVSSSKRASMTKAERLSASRRKKKADPGQQSKTGAAKPTYVRTDKPKKKTK